MSPDGSRMSSGSIDETVRVWDAFNGVCLHVLEGHTDSVSAVCITPDGTRIISGSSDATLRAWNSVSGACLLVLKGHTGGVESVCMSTDGSRIILGGGSMECDTSVRVWDALSGACLLALQGHTRPVQHVYMTPDGSHFISCGGLDIVRSSVDTTVQARDASSGRCLSVLEGHTSPVRHACTSSDGSRIFLSSQNGTVRVWDASTATAISAAPLAMLESLPNVGRGGSYGLRQDFYTYTVGRGAAMLPVAWGLQQTYGCYLNGSIKWLGFTRPLPLAPAGMVVAAVTTDHQLQMFRLVPPATDVR